MMLQTLERGRLLAAGDLDTSFGAGGFASADAGSSAGSVAVQDDGKILVASSVPSNTPVALERLTANRSNFCPRPRGR
jgi:hypothetical protein